ncbi:putative sigma factor [Streptomyces bingchenggensis BCW-1]|uniref:Putative sigma factor n=1 Tax=Streptomyces bingchenggensis (strain BCW-1) TaxID=749414 RepID=D7BVX1_STRBB|nr:MULTISPECIES: RNA polymerase sigma factor [Streptomyces]ADI09700.1 putative sigma factor [Streptomyces bingchenggensis BCW-1]
MIREEHTDDTDGELLRRSQRDPTAFEPLVARHSAALHGYLVRRAPGAADDLLSELWLRAYASRHGFDAARGTARAWLFGVARNVLAAHWRRLETEASPGSARFAEGIAGDPWHAVDQRLDAAAVAPVLRHALTKLPAVERELMLLIAWEQLTPTEAASVIGVPPGTARSRLHRARTRLRERLGAFVSSAQMSKTGESA